MSNVVEVNDPDVMQDLLNTHPVVVAKFTAPSWCVPCRQFAPHYVKAADSASIRSDALGQVVFTSIDLDLNDWAAKDYGVRSVPTVMLFMDGQHVADLKGRSAVKFLDELTYTIQRRI